MGLNEYVTVVRLRWRVLAAVVLLVVAGVVTVTSLMTPQYSTKATVYFDTQPKNQDEDEDEDKAEEAAELADAVLYPQTVVKAYSETATGSSVLNPVISELGLRRTPQELAEQVEATAPLGTVVVEIKVTDRSARLAAEIANAVARELAEISANELSAGAEDKSSDGVIRVRTIAKAGVPGAPSSPKVTLSVAIAVFWGLLAGIALCIWWDRVDPRVRTRRDLTTVTPAPLLGFLPPEGRRWSGIGPPRHGAAGRIEWGQLRGNFALLRDAQALRSTLFVSPARPAAAERLVTHLSGALLANGARVLVIDADFKAVSPHEVPRTGLSSVLRGDVSLRDAVVRFPDQPALLPPGPPVNDPAGALGSDRMAEILREAEQDYDVVLLRTSPLLAATEGLALSRSVDGVILVGDEDAIPRDLLDRALAAVDRAGGHVRGVVLSS